MSECYYFFFKFFCYVRGEIAFKYKTLFDMAGFYYEIIADQTTPDAVLLAADSAVTRMYPNGTTEGVVGDINTKGCVKVFVML